MGGGWSQMCGADAGGTALQVWLPPGPAKQATPGTGYPRDMAYAPAWSSGQPPEDLVLAMARGGRLEYGVNVFKDGRTVIQSMGCPEDHRPHIGRIAPSDVDRLVAAARSSHFADETDAYTYATDTEKIVVAMYDGCSLKFAYATEASRDGEKLLGVADLIDRTVGTAVLVPSLTDRERIHQLGPP
jgi:hypothetical protein